MLLLITPVNDDISNISPFINLSIPVPTLRKGSGRPMLDLLKRPAVQCLAS